MLSSMSIPPPLRTYHEELPDAALDSPSSRSTDTLTDEETLPLGMHLEKHRDRQREREVKERGLTAERLRQHEKQQRDPHLSKPALGISDESGSEGGFPLVPPAMRLADIRTVDSGKSEKVASGSPTNKINHKHVPRIVDEPGVFGKHMSKELMFGRGAPGSIPQAHTPVVQQDRGCAMPRFMRGTGSHIPQCDSLQQASGLPLGLLCQPFAVVPDRDAEVAAGMCCDTNGGVPLLDYTEDDILRCPRCRAYANPFFQWLDSGRGAVCNMCRAAFDVPSNLRCSLDQKHMRKDRLERQEFIRGTVDMLIPTSWCPAPSTPLKPPAFVLVVDMTPASLKLGLHRHALASFVHSVLTPQEDEEEEELEVEEVEKYVSVVTFTNTNVSFYSFSKPDADAHELVVGDNFCPAPTSTVCVPLSVHRDRLVDLCLRLSAVTDSGETTTFSSAAVSPSRMALEAVGDMMEGGEHVGAQVLAVCSLTPAKAGKAKANGTLEQVIEGGCLKQPLAASNRPEAVAMKTLADAWVQANVCCDFFFAATRTGDASSSALESMHCLALLSSSTGGSHSLYSHIGEGSAEEALNVEQLRGALAHSVNQPRAWGCAVKLRTSAGFDVSRLYAPWQSKATNSEPSCFEVSSFPSSTAIYFSLRHEDGVEKPDQAAHFQLACLYTRSDGRKVVRVHTLELGLTASIPMVFKYVDSDALIGGLIRRAASSLLHDGRIPLQMLEQTMVDALFAYRRHCGAKAASSQLLMSETLMPLPLALSSLPKVAHCLRHTAERVEERIASMYELLALPAAECSHRLYPRIYPMHALKPHEAVLDQRRLDAGQELVGTLALPATTPASGQDLWTDGLYLVDKGTVLALCVGASTSGRVLQECFQALAVEELQALTGRVPLEWSCGGCGEVESVGTCTAASSTDPLLVAGQGRRSDCSSGSSQGNEMMRAAAACKGKCMAHKVQMAAAEIQDRRRMMGMAVPPLLLALPSSDHLTTSTVEDAASGHPSYVDALCQLHKRVQRNLD